MIQGEVYLYCRAELAGEQAGSAEVPQQSRPVGQQASRSVYEGSGQVPQTDKPQQAQHAQQPQELQHSQHAEEALDGYESQSDKESNCLSQSEADTVYESACESAEAESDAQSYFMDLPLQSHSVPAALSMAHNIKAEAHSLSKGRATPSPPCRISPVSSQDEGTQEVQHAQQEDGGATAETPADLQLRVDSANAKAFGGTVIEEQANGSGSSDDHYCSALDAGQALLSNGQGAEHKQEAAQQAPAVATTEHSKHSCLSGLIPSFRKMKRKSRASAESATFIPAAAVATAADEAAAAGATLPDSSPQRRRRILHASASQQD